MASIRSLAGIARSSGAYAAACMTSVGLALAHPGPAHAQAAATTDSRQIMAEMAVKSRLKDPDSAIFTWTNRWVTTSSFKLLRWSKPRSGEFSCGQVNARWSLGGYSGPTYFLVFIADGAVAELHMDFNELGTTFAVARARCRTEGF